MLSWVAVVVLWNDRLGGHRIQPSVMGHLGRQRKGLGNSSGIHLPHYDIRHREPKIPQTSEVQKPGPNPSNLSKPFHAKRGITWLYDDKVHPHGMDKKLENTRIIGATDKRNLGLSEWPRAMRMDGSLTDSFVRNRAIHPRCYHRPPIHPPIPFPYMHSILDQAIYLRFPLCILKPLKCPTGRSQVCKKGAIEITSQVRKAYARGFLISPDSDRGNISESNISPSPCLSVPPIGWRFSQVAMNCHALSNSIINHVDPVIYKTMNHSSAHPFI